MTARFAAIAVAVVVTGAAVAQEAPATYGGAMAWYGRGVAAGDADAQYLAGYRAETGVMGAADATEAERLYGLAAAAGHDAAAYRLGRLRLERGDGPGARQVLLVAAGHGHVGAQSLLGYLLGRDAEGPDGLREAAYWLERAARAGDATATLNLTRLAPRLDEADRAAVAARLAGP